MNKIEAQNLNRMGHYYSEMYSDDRTPEQKKEDANKQKRRKQLEKHLCDMFKCKRGELKIVHEILKESWNYGND